MAVVIETTLGDITVDLYLEQRPVTCLNFLKLCKMKYYNYNLFHSIRSGFIAQTGDPTGEGSGGQSVFGLLEGPEKRFFSGEKRPKIRHSDVGLLSMVGTGDMMIGSQFFFTLASDLDSLDGVHCVIGEVTEGHEVLRKLNDVICDELHRPYRDVRITHTVVLEDPFNDPPGLRAPSRSPSPSAERLKGGRIAPDEEIDETLGKSAAEIQEMIEEKEAKARATILEIVGDLPDADIAPPENVLFVCKLNPVTSDDDLEIIFSRFGKIVSCEVIRDKKTGDSLQYAFIEFADKKSCEDAYFKMGNVLIDDRRIHVDFSQSVSKMKWLGKGRGVKYYNDDDHKSPIPQREMSRRSQSKEKEYKNRTGDRNSYNNIKTHEYKDRKKDEIGHGNRYDKKVTERSKRRSKSPMKVDTSKNHRNSDHNRSRNDIDSHSRTHEARKNVENVKENKSISNKHENDISTKISRSCRPQSSPSRNETQSEKNDRNTENRSTDRKESRNRKEDMAKDHKFEQQERIDRITNREIENRSKGKGDNRSINHNSRRDQSSEERTELRSQNRHKERPEIREERNDCNSRSSDKTLRNNRDEVQRINRIRKFDRNEWNSDEEREDKTRDRKENRTKDHRDKQNSYNANKEANKSYRDKNDERKNDRRHYEEKESLSRDNKVDKERNHKELSSRDNNKSDREKSPSRKRKYKNEDIESIKTKKSKHYSKKGEHRTPSPLEKNRRKRSKNKVKQTDKSKKVSKKRRKQSTSSDSSSESSSTSESSSSSDSDHKKKSKRRRRTSSTSSSSSSDSSSSSSSSSSSESSSSSSSSSDSDSKKKSRKHSNKKKKL